MFFLDSNTCIYYLNGASESIRKRIIATPPVDIKIPSIVKFHQGILVTRNVDEFSRVQGLHIENWWED